MLRMLVCALYGYCLNPMSYPAQGPNTLFAIGGSFSWFLLTEGYLSRESPYGAYCTLYIPIAIDATVYRIAVPVVRSCSGRCGCSGSVLGLGGAGDRMTLFPRCDFMELLVRLLIASDDRAR